MNIDYPPTAVLNLIEDLLSNQIVYARELGNAAEVNRDQFDLYEDVENQVKAIKLKIVAEDLSTSYANHLARDLEKVRTAFSTGYGSKDHRLPIVLKTLEEKITFKNQQERREPEIRAALEGLKITADFFIKLDFLNRNLVIVGSNGSGKTTLATQLPKHIKNKGVIIAAQRVLMLKHLDSIRRHGVTSEDLKEMQIRQSRSLDGRKLATDFEVLIEHLIADDSRMLRQNRDRTRMHENPFPPTKLQILLAMWNSLFPHVQISLSDDINIGAKKDSLTFHTGEMSEGEKVAMFLIAHVLLCPYDGFVIVDEPEMYLHPAVYKKLWDRLESERNDCKFIYLTHNLDFAASRVGAKKLWLRSFIYPNIFGLEEIPTGEIPESLLLELLGSRQTILFCEGELSGLDESIYRILFSQHTIKPVGGCLNVINFTKAFNKLSNTMSTAIGIIDSDFHGQDRLESLEKEGVYNIRLPEIENILFDETVLRAVCHSLNKSNVADPIKNEVLKRLSTEKDFQVSSYVSARVDHYFKDSNVPKGNNIAGLLSNYNEFLQQIAIQQWANEQETKVDKVLGAKDYNEAIRIFNYKGLESIANTALKIRDYNLQAINLIRNDFTLRNHLQKYFPKLNF